MQTLTCKICSRTEEQFQSDIRLGEGLAAFVSTNPTKFVRCGYGSKFDLSVYHINDELFEDFKLQQDDPICDDCIESFIGSGLTFANEYDPFDGPCREVKIMSEAEQKLIMKCLAQGGELAELALEVVDEYPVETAINFMYAQELKPLKVVD